MSHLNGLTVPYIEIIQRHTTPHKGLGQIITIIVARRLLIRATPLQPSAVANRVQNQAKMTPVGPQRRGSMCKEKSIAPSTSFAYCQMLFGHLQCWNI